jgi:amino acid transporter
MQIIGMLIFLFVWLLILWLGSISLEATGMERAKARFQALSALTGTGFTTKEAESIVNHPRRRRIATWLIFLGSVGIVTFLLLLILYLRAGLNAPTLGHIIVIVATVLVFVLLIWTGIINKLSNGIIKLFHKTQVYIPEEILHQSGDYGIARVKIGKTDGTTGLTIGNTKYKERNIIILAIERDEKVLSQPKDDESVLAGDYLLCYGKVSDFGGFE